MSRSTTPAAVLALLGLACPTLVRSAEMTPDVRAKVQSSAKTLLAWGSDPKIVEAVKAYNATAPAEARAMTNEKWKSLQVLDPFVRSFTRNALAEYLKSKRDASVTELFVSGADGGKVAFFAKTSSWSHKASPKHAVPMTGKTWYGPVEVDESTGQQQVQVGIPVLDGGKPVGSIVIGLGISRLK